MDAIYPAGPASVPANLTAPTAAYKRHAWLAMAGLAAFLAAYFGLLGWFAWTAWRLFAVAGSNDSGQVGAIFVGSCAAFLAVFMAKALVFVKRGGDVDDLELKPADQPELFAFLHRLADDAGAPRPHRVFLSARVNAAVFYDLSLANLLLPSRKNLEIGMGLANVLSLGEFKAVLGHEFGHFAQRTMAVSRWVYVAHQIAAHIIAKRDALDKFLDVVSRFDLRVAWIGWALKLVVWSIRSLVELVFRVVVIAQRALSRVMEYQADLVAASLTGSDALVSSLHRLHAADDALDRAIDFAAGERDAGRPVLDVFAVQQRIIEHMRTILADPHYGQSTTPAADAPERHRVFRTELAKPPQMWATHPANIDREENLKRVYLAADIDPRPALVLFRDHEALRQRLTRELFTGEAPEPVPLADSFLRLDKGFSRPSLDRRYRGTFLWRSPFRGCERPTELYGADAPASGLVAALDALYPHEHGERIDRERELTKERATLEAVRAGYLKAAGGIVRWRGDDVRLRELPRVLREIDAELEPLRRDIREHDRRCRSLHEAAARAAGEGWDAYLRSLAALVHYAEHAEANLRDARGLLGNTFAVITADGRVSADELRKLILVANDVQSALAQVHQGAPTVTIDAAIAAHLGVASWPEALGEFGLPPANEANINQWMPAVDSWVEATAGALGALHRAALEELLATEDMVADAVRAGTRLEAAPPALTVPAEYRVLLPGRERKRSELGWWDRFQTAQGAVPTIARLLAAGGIVGAVLMLGGGTGQRDLVVYNGLTVPVDVDIDGVLANVAPLGHTEVAVPTGTHHVVARSGSDGRTIEAFDAESETGGQFVYNIAGAAVLVEWTAAYGSASPEPEHVLGHPRWTSTRAEYVFDEPPSQVRVKNGGGETRSALSAVPDMPPGQYTGQLPAAEQASLAQAHARWDSTGSRYVLDWMQMAGAQPDYAQLLAERLAASPDDVLLQRLHQDALTGAPREAACAQAHTLMRQFESADHAYLALRCEPDSPAQGDAVLAAQAKWPDNAWLALAAGHVRAARMEWAQSLPLLEEAAQRLPAMTSGITMDIVRVRRILGQASTAELQPLLERSHDLAQALATEGVGEGGEASPFGKLARGELEASVAAAQDPQMAKYVLWLAAASDGAPRALVARALGSSLPAADENSAWAALALASREGSDVAALEQSLRATGLPDSAAILDFFAAVRAGEGQAADAHLASTSFHGRAMAYAMAAIYLGERCPPAWRQLAAQALYAFERPYLG
jgi:Zn-dependent protease with chaperone function